MGSFEDFQNAMSGIQSVENVIPGVSALQGLGNKLIGSAGGILDLASNPIFIIGGGAIVLLILLK